MSPELLTIRVEHGGFPRVSGDEPMTPQSKQAAK